MHISIGNRTCKVETAQPKTLDTLWDFMSVQSLSEQQAFFARRRYGYHGDGMKRFLHKGTRKFPTGLLPLALEMLSEYGVKPKLTDERGCIPQHKPLRSYLHWNALLRYRKFPVEPYLTLKQFTAATAVFRSTLEGYPKIRFPRGIVSLPTGSGKTVIAFFVARRYHRPTIYLVNRQDLLLQGMGVYEQLTGYRPGMVGISHFEPKLVTCATIQTLAKGIRENNSAILSLLYQTEVVIVDEAHEVSDNYYLDVLNAMPNASVRVALGGSMLRKSDLDNWNMMGAFGGVIHHTPSKDLRDKGLLAKTKVYLFSVTHPKSRARWPKDEKEVILNNEYRNMLGIATAVRAASFGWVSLLLVSKVEHGEILQGMFRSMGIVDIPFLCYVDPAQRRKQYLDEMRSGRQRIVISSGIFKMGIDVPLIRCVIRMDGGKSAIDSLQIPGRGMRRKAVHNELYMVDFVDQTSKRFQDRSKDRIKVYMEEGFDVVKVADPEDIPFADLNPTNLISAR